MEYQLREIPNIYKFKSNYLRQHASKIETLLLGSSHTLYDLNPEYFTDKTFNLGHLSQSLDIDYKLLEYYIDEMPNLKTVVLRLSYSTLFEKLEDTNEAWRIKNYNIYYPFSLKQHQKYNYEVLSVKLKNNLDRLKGFYLEGENFENWNNLGWGTDLRNSNNEADLEALGELTAKKHTADNNKLFPELSKTLNRFIKLCEINNINVILFTPPAYKSYVEHLNATQFNAMEKLGTTIALNSENCKYFNFIKDDSFTNIHFFDADHLNAKGAKKLSDLINTIVEN